MNSFIKSSTGADFDLYLLKMSSQYFERAPLYEQLAREIRNREISMRRPGDALPSEPALTVKYAVSRTTVRKAMDLLERQNLVQRRQGSGTYVQNQAGPERDVALLMEADLARSLLSPYYTKLLQEVRLALFRRGISSRPYLGYAESGVEMDDLTCQEIMRDLNLNRLNGVISIVATPHPSWISKFRQRLLPVLGGNASMDYYIAVDTQKLARRILDRFRAQERKRLLLLDWRRGNDDDVWVTRDVVAEYGLSLVECRIPMGADHGQIELAWEGFRQQIQGDSLRPDCLLVCDDMLFERTQNLLDELRSDGFEPPDTAVYGSDAMKLSPRFPITRYIFSVTARAQRLAETMARCLERQEVERFIALPVSMVPVSQEALLANWI